MRKGIEDFIFVLIAGIIALLLAFLVGHYAFQPGPPDVIPVENLSLGVIGYTSEYEGKIYNIGSFTAGETHTERLKYVPELRISASLAGSEKKTYIIQIPDYYLSVMKSVKLGFQVIDTNTYGNLIIKWNGKTIYKDRAEKKFFSIPIEPSYVKATNTLEIFCEPPGMFFWASTVYLLRDFKLELDYGEIKVVPFTLSPQEIETFTHGNLRFKSGPGKGKLIIKVNGIPIYNKHPSAWENIDFDFFNATLNFGNNILTFSTDTGSFYLTDTVLTIYLSTNKVSLTKTFYLSEENFQKLNSSQYKGKIEYKIEKVLKPGNLVIKLNGNKLSDVSSSQGWHTIYFNNHTALAGNNELSFSGTGSWEIPEVRIWLERVES